MAPPLGFQNGRKLRVSSCVKPLLFKICFLSYSKAALSLFLRVRAHRRPIRCGAPSRSTYTRASRSITCLSCVSGCAPRECAAAGFLLRAAGLRDHSSAQRDRPAGPPCPAQKGPSRISRSRRRDPPPRPASRMSRPSLRRACLTGNGTMTDDRLVLMFNVQNNGH